MSDEQPPEAAPADPSAQPPSRSHGTWSIRASLAPRDLMEERPAPPARWRAQVITLLPQAFPGVLGQSLTGRALDDGLWSLQTVDLRAFGEGRHRNVDDTPSGGGAGMVLRADVVGRAVESVLAGTRGRVPFLYLSPRGRPFDQGFARALAAGDGVNLLCGRFEGLDERVIDHFDLIEVSLGDFVLTGGEIAAQAMIDACVRLLPGVLGNADSTQEESHSAGLLEHPQYTRPAIWQGRPIPQVLMSGNHAEIARWRREMAEALTRDRRPDLWARHIARQAPGDPHDGT